MIVYPSVFYDVPFPYPFLIFAVLVRSSPITTLFKGLCHFFILLFAVFEPKYLTIYLPWIFVKNLFEIGQLATKQQPIM